MKIRVAISDQFLKAYSSLQLNTQQKVRNFIDRFKIDPMASGINYETIQAAADPNMRSVRIGDDYRAIVLKPKTGNVYALLWVDHHDEAYAWAEKKRAVIHPETGSLQILTTEETVAADLPTQATVVKGLFSSYKERELLRLGVPEVLLPVVRNLKDIKELDQAAKYLPEEASEALYALAAGYSLEEFHAERENVLAQNTQATAVDTDDFATALENPDTLRRFVLIDNDQELESLLNAPLEKWRVFLHPSQRKIVTLDLKGSIRVLGGAGTGKTVVAIHRAKWLAERLTSSNDRILFTTFTKNLALDIQSNLRKICSPEQMKRIEVVHLDRWVQQFLNKQGYSFRLTYQGPDAKRKVRQCWERALTSRPDDMDLSESFYRDEWTQVIAAQGLTTAAEYFKASRVGRGTALNRAQRNRIWQVFQELRLQLKEQGLREVDDAYRDARDLLLQKPNILPYRHVLVDETQDMGEQALKLLRQIVPLGPNDLFFVGDAHQRIYRHKVVLRNCGISIQGRNHSHRLKINYRTTDEIRKWAVSLLENCSIDDLDDGRDSAQGYQSLMHGELPRVRLFKTFGQEADFLAETVESLKQTFPLKHICICARTRDQVETYAQELDQRGIPIHIVQPNQEDSDGESGLRLATMHRVKGLEFDVMLVAGAVEGKLPLQEALSDLGDETEREYAEIRERSLLYVAATRAKQQLYITAYGHPSAFLAEHKLSDDA